MGDFSLLTDLPEMYRHCKATEDKDMTAIDFITDHLVNIDELFDNHQNGDEQKPHQPIQNNHHGLTTASFISEFTFSITQFQPTIEKPLFSSVNFFRSDYFSKIFRPPTV
jgi:hypothetical protein